MTPELSLFAQNLSFSYERNRAVLTHISFMSRAGEVHGVLGPNGSGKSTLLQVLSGWLKPTSGCVLIADNDAAMAGASPQNIAFVPQREEGCFPFTVLETVLFGRYSTSRGFRMFESEEDVAIARDALVAVDLLSYAERPAGTLSVGERQRVLIARAIAQQTKILLLDEPTSALDLHHQRAMMRLISKFAQRDKKAVVVALHDLNLAAAYCDKVTILQEGRIVISGPPQEILTRELVRSVYDVDVDFVKTDAGNWMLPRL